MYTQSTKAAVPDRLPILLMVDLMPRGVGWCHFLNIFFPFRYNNVRDTDAPWGRVWSSGMLEGQVVLCAVHCRRDAPRIYVTCNIA